MLAGLYLVLDFLLHGSRTDQFRPDVERPIPALGLTYAATHGDILRRVADLSDRLDCLHGVVTEADDASPTPPHVTYAHLRETTNSGNGLNRRATCCQSTDKSAWN